MAARSPARFLAPLALLGFVLALLLIVSHSSSDGGSTGNGTKSSQEQSAPTPAANSGGKSSSKSKGPRFYTVKVGDTPSAIAEKTGVPLSTIEQLNPSLDPQALSPGERIKLRK
jgi:LysM repeat protein